MLSGTIWLWIGFNVFVLAMLALDLGIFHRKAYAVSIKEASIWSVVWITLAMAFNAGVYFFSGPEPALQFFTGYLIEKSLSVDNIFVFWAALHLLQCTGGLSTPGAFLGCSRCPCNARYADCARDIPARTRSTGLSTCSVPS